MKSLWHDVGLPTQLEFGHMAPGRRPMIFPKSNYVYQLWFDNFENHGFYFDNAQAALGAESAGAAARGARRGPRRCGATCFCWREERVEGVERRRREPQAVPRHHDVRAVACERPQAPARGGALCRSDLRLGHWPSGSDVLSAYSAYTLAMPGFLGLGVDKPLESFIADHTLREPQADISAPGGTDAIQRGNATWVNPPTSEGSAAFPEVHSGRIRFDLIAGSAEHAVSPARWRHGRASRPRPRGRPAEARDGDLRQGWGSCIPYGRARWSPGPARASQLGTR